MKAKMLDGKVAIITGASYGIGKAIAEVFAEEGASLVLTARGKDKLDAVVESIREKGGKAVGVVADTRSNEDTRHVFEVLMEEYGDLDILVNNAGFGEQKPIDETDDAWMNMVLDTNLGGVLRYTNEALKIFLPKNEGRIINLSSICATRPWCGASYNASKGAISNITLHTAMRCVNTGIRCNAIAPGSTRTPAYITCKQGKQDGGLKMLDYGANEFIYYRPGPEPCPEVEPEDIGFCALYLASELGRGVQGQVIQVCNGGFL